MIFLCVELIVGDRKSPAQLQCCSPADFGSAGEYCFDATVYQDVTSCLDS